MGANANRHVRGLLATAMAIALAGAIAAPAGAASIVVNGGFESGSFSGWTETGDNGLDFVSSGGAHTGTYSAYFGPIGTVGGIQQSLATAANTRYDVSFWLQSSGDAPASFSWGVNGASALTLASPAASGYTQYTGSFLAAGSSTLLQFNFRNDVGYWGLDDVSVSAAVPEPGQWMLLLSGVGVLVAWRRSRPWGVRARGIPRGATALRTPRPR